MGAWASGALAPGSWEAGAWEADAPGAWATGAWAPGAWASGAWEESAGGGEPSTVVSDTFTRADSTTTLGSAETGQPWTAHAGTWGIQANQAYAVSGGTGDLATVDAGVADGNVSATLTNTSNNGLVFRFLSTSQYLMARWNGTAVQLWKYNSGFTQLGTAALAGSGFHRLSVDLDGDSVRVLVDDVQRLAVTLSAADQATYGAATRFGMRSVEGTVRFDDFTVSAVAAGPTVVYSEPVLAVEDARAAAAASVLAYSSAAAVEDESADAEAAVLVFSRAAAVEEESAGVEAHVLVYSGAAAIEEEVALATSAVLVYSSIEAVEDEVADVEEAAVLDYLSVGTLRTRPALSATITRRP